MGLYDNVWSHVYEEIKRFYPVWYRDVLEMDAIWRTQGEELDGVRSTIERIVFNGYINTADAETIAKYESFLEITPEPGATLEDRRAQIMALMFPSPHIGAPEICSIIRIFTTGKSSVTFSRGVIGVTVTCAFDERFCDQDCVKVLQARIPSHLSLRLTKNICAKSPVVCCLGGRMAAVTRLPVPEEADGLSFEGVLHMGGAAASAVCLPVPAAG